MKVETNPNKTNIEITSGQSNVRFDVREQTTEVMGLKSNVKGPSAEWEWSTKEDKSNKVQTIGPESTEIQYPSAKCVYEAFQDIPEFVQKQSDWSQTDTEEVDYIKNKPNLSTVATSGSYNDLSDRPTKVSQFSNDVDYLEADRGYEYFWHQADWNESDTGKLSYILNKPDLTLKEDKSNKVTSISSSSTDTQYPSAKAVYDAIPTVLPVLIKYVRVDSVTDYTIPSEPVGTMYAISIEDGIGTVTIHATSGTWLHWKSDGCRNFYPAGTGSPEVTTSMTDTGGGTRTINLFIRMH